MKIQEIECGDIFWLYGQCVVVIKKWDEYGQVKVIDRQDGIHIVFYELLRPIRFYFEHFDEALSILGVEYDNEITKKLCQDDDAWSKENEYCKLVFYAKSGRFDYMTAEDKTTGERFGLSYDNDYIHKMQHEFRELLMSRYMETFAYPLRYDAELDPLY